VPEEAWGDEKVEEDKASGESFRYPQNHEEAHEKGSPPEDGAGPFDPRSERV
jgi:hypothetical protein